MKFHHIGIATQDINSCLQFVKNNFDINHISDIVYDKNQDANLCLINLQDGSNIELVCGEIVKNYLKKRIFLYHTCFEVKDIHQSVQKLQKQDCILIVKPVEAILFDDRKVAFLQSKLGLIELLEEKK